MRTSKKFLSMILAVIMIVGTFSAVSAYAFDDVEDYQNQIALMSELKIVEGYDDTTFGYGEDVQRWQMALWIAKIMTGKVYDAYVNWYSTENYTNFTDINPDQFYGSISYGVENGIILGKSDVSFDPTAGITFQEAFTMVVRMLGYGSSAMDATYPWSYVDKAIKLGLDNGLRADYNNEEVATREEIVVILYNALFAPKADGTTFGEKNFNLKMDTIVITGTVRGNMFTDARTDKKAADDTHYVTFSILDTAANKLQTGVSYYLPRSAFAPFLDSDDLAATLKIGYSYDVVTKDDYTTLLYVRENDVVVVDQDKLTGATSSSASLTIGSDAYKAVSSYSTLAINNQGTKTTKEFEIVLYNGRGTDVAIGGVSYLRNATFDIVDADGKVILTWVAHNISGGVYPDGVYMVRTADGSTIFREPTSADWDKAAAEYFKKYPSALSTLYAAIGDTYASITRVNAYSDTWLFDDDGNSDYDRGIYVYYSFGKITAAKINDKMQLVSDAIPGDGRLDPVNTVYDSDVAYIDVDKYIAGEDYVISAADVVGKYCLYAYNPVTNIFYLKKTYEPQKGYVTTVNKPARTITFDQVYYGYLNGTITGSTYKVGVENLPGGNYDAVLNSYRDFDTLKGRTVYYVLDEKYSSILRIYDYGNDAGFVVIKDNIASVNTTGYANVLAYANSNIASVITIASVDGYTTVSGYAAVNNVQPGDLYSATVDALGMYHLTYIAPNQFDYFASQSYTNTWADVKSILATGTGYKLLDLNFTNGVSYTEAQKAQTITVNASGKPSVNAPAAYYDDANGVAKAFGNFKTDKNTVIILVNEDDQTGSAPYHYDSKQLVVNGYLRTLNFEAIKGVPADGSHIYMMDAYDYSLNAQLIAQAENAHTSPLTPVNTLPYQNFGTRIFAAVNDKNVAKFVYIVNGTWGGNIAVNPAASSDNLDSNDTIIYVDEHTMATMVATNQTATGLGVSIGTVYKYDNAIDFIRGGITSAYTGAMYNQRLYAGRFYYVEDGYVVGEVTVGATNQPTVVAGAPAPAYDIEVVRLAYVNDYVSVYQRWDTTVDTGIGGGAGLWTSSFGKPIIYEVNDMYVTYEKSSTVLDEATTSKPKDIVDTVAKLLQTDDNAFVTAYVYTGERTRLQSLDGQPRLYSGQQRLFITADYAKGSEIPGTSLTTLSKQLNNITITVANPDGTTTTQAPFNGFIIDKQTYDAISYYINAYNDDKNQQYAGVNTTMRAYEGSIVVTGTKAVPMACGAYFENGVTTIATYVEQGFTPRYYLEIKDCVLNEDCLVHGPKNAVYLQWTNPYNTNETYTLQLLGGVSN